MKRYRITWTSPYLKKDRVRVLTLWARSKEQAKELWAKLFCGKAKVEVCRG